MKGWEILLLAFGWVMVIEGITPLVAPERWKALLAELIEAPVPALRAAAGVVVAVGVIIVWTFLGDLPVE
ncbi:DUF2065 domain-containing protein [Sutterella sp.]|uniref:DUF2065 domain-containing protein n=1 Tax=Sutterella sp. TaxID=1981025 RepID=UPI0025EEF264|nr:DUF2065 domain-containing protein [uncultured Sutterella sp.]